MRASYSIHKLYWQDFENLTIDVCHERLGIAATKFEDGQDGGRDSTFEGTAKAFPSTNNPWSGKFVIQAKHTSDPTKSCSDPNFSSNAASSKLSKEIVKLKKIKKNNGLDNYLLFTNRKLTGVKYPALTNRIKSEVGLSNVEIIGRQHLGSILEKIPHIVSKYGLGNTYPIRFYEKDIKEVIRVFDENIEDISTEAGEASKTYQYLEKEGKGNKNDLNGLGKEYFEFMKENSLSYFQQITNYLKDPINNEYRRRYQTTAQDLQAKILLKRDEFNAFENLIEDLIDYVYDRCADELNQARAFIRVFIHFMYFECDIGKKESAQ